MSPPMSAPLPQSFTQLVVRCERSPAHPLPVAMTFKGMGKARDGRAVAVYACNDPNCWNHKDVVPQFATGRPQVLRTYPVPNH